jgi:hypothetical protein
MTTERTASATPQYLREPGIETRGSSPPCHRADEDLSEEIAGDLQLPDGQRVGSTPDS